MTLNSVATLIVQHLASFVYRLLVDRNVSRICVAVIFFERLEWAVYKFYMIKIVLYNLDYVYSRKSV